jgi:hypothetical protein
MKQLMVLFALATSIAAQASEYECRKPRYLSNGGVVVTLSTDGWARYEGGDKVNTYYSGGGLRTWFFTDGIQIQMDPSGDSRVYNFAGKTEAMPMTTLECYPRGSK